MPQEETERLSVLYNRPRWLVERYIKEWGKERALEILTAKGCDKTHIRPAASYGKDALRAYLEAKGISYDETPYGYNIGSVGEVGELLRKGEATVMSKCSVEICAAVPVKGEEILDMCAAPGGKSVCLAERYPARVIACDKHPHRVELIRQYAERMHVRNVESRCMDSTVFEPSFEDRFMTVLLDAPCSGLGTVWSNPDVVLHRKESDLAGIIATQRALLEVAARYVKKGGSLVYATCSDLPSEDSHLVADFLHKYAEFALRTEKYTETDETGGEGYYYAVLEKV